MPLQARHERHKRAAAGRRARSARCADFRAATAAGVGRTTTTCCRLAGICAAASVPSRAFSFFRFGGRKRGVLGVACVAFQALSSANYSACGAFFSGGSGLKPQRTRDGIEQFWRSRLTPAGSVYTNRARRCVAGDLATSTAYCLFAFFWTWFGGERWTRERVGA